MEALKAKKQTVASLKNELIRSLCDLLTALSGEFAKKSITVLTPEEDDKHNAWLCLNDIFKKFNIVRRQSNLDEFDCGPWLTKIKRVLEIQYSKLLYSPSNHEFPLCIPTIKNMLQILE